MAKQRIIGIDLGTTNSCVAVWEGSGVTVIENLEGQKITPSVVSFTPSGRKIGETAKRQAAIYPEMTIRSVKRLMGESYDSLKENLGQFSYNVVKGAHGYAVISLENALILPQQVSAYILGYLKNCAENYLNEPVTEAVITVPAYFTEIQREATKEAARIAGLNVRRLLNEPTAAALAYCESGINLGTVIVFDLGGGTFDISMLSCSQNIYDVFGNGGDTNLGGDDIDDALTKVICSDYLNYCEPGTSLDSKQMMRLREEAEKLKKSLSFEITAELSLPWLVPESKTNPHLVRTLSRTFLNEIAMPVVSRCREICIETIERTNTRIEDIDHVLLVGGSSKMPCIREMVEEVFHRKPVISQDAEQIVAVGAAIEGAMISGAIRDRQLMDETPLALGVMTKGRIFDVIIEPNTTIPVSKTIRYECASSEQRSATILVVQGRNAYDTKCKRVGCFDITDIHLSDSGLPEVDVTFDIDQNGLLTVTAKDVMSGKASSRVIGNAGMLTLEQLQELQSDICDTNTELIYRIKQYSGDVAQNIDDNAQK